MSSHAGIPRPLAGGPASRPSVTGSPRGASHAPVDAPRRRRAADRDPNACPAAGNGVRPRAEGRRLSGECQRRDPVGMVSAGLTRDAKVDPALFDALINSLGDPSSIASRRSTTDFVASTSCSSVCALRTSRPSA